MPSSHSMAPVGMAFADESARLGEQDMGDAGGGNFGGGALAIQCGMRLCLIDFSRGTGYSEGNGHRVL